MCGDIDGWSAQRSGVLTCVSIVWAVQYRLDCNVCECGVDDVVYLQPVVASVFARIAIASMSMTCDDGDLDDVTT